MISVPDFKTKQIVTFIAKDGDKISFSNDNVIIKNIEGDIKHQSTCHRIFMLIVFGDTSITTGIIKRAKNFGFSIVFMSYSFKLIQSVHNAAEANTILKIRQYTLDKDMSQKISNWIIDNKIINQISAINKLRINKKDNENYTKILSLNNKCNTCSTIQELMGIEGNAAKLYFKVIFSEFNWKGRRPRIKSDYLNVLLDIGYNMLFNFIDAILVTFGFDTYKGILHQVFYMRKSLVCDIIEPFRPIIDLQIIKSINLKQFKEEDFIFSNNKYSLDIRKTGYYTSIFLKSILDNKEDIFVYIQSFYRNFIKQREIEDYKMYRL